MDDTTVKVAVRIRPQSTKEVLDMCQVCSHVVPGEPQIVLGNDKSFTFDHVLLSNSTQEEVYVACCSELIQGTFEGYNATILAYGQTGSGKTYTMGTSFDTYMAEDQIGIIPRAVQHLFKGIDRRKIEAVANALTPPDFKVHAQFMELYNEEINDLLDSTKDTSEKGKKSLIRIHEDANGGIYTVGATTRLVSSLEDTMECLKIGATLRATGSTHMNVYSSRSHAIFTLHIKQQRVCKEKTSEDCSETETKVLSAKFHFVDLAGSERLKRTGATGDRAKEGISINCGLLALGNVISALGDKAKKGIHVPYRDSKLTRLLQDSLGGNSQTLMIACISPSDRDFVETLNTLKYANRARNIKNKVSINQDMSSKQLSALRAEIQSLQRELMEYKLGRKSMESSSSSVSMLQSGDIAFENQLLSKENEGLKQRMKGLQQTVESLRTRNIELMRDRDLEQLSRSETVVGMFDEELKKKLESYIKEAEDYRVKFIESESILEAIKSSQNNKILRSPDDVKAFKMSPDDHVNELLLLAQKDLDLMRNKFREKSISLERDTVTGDEDNENEETEMGEDELKESDEELSESEVQSHSLSNLDSNIAQLSSEISVKEKLMEELKLSHAKMKNIQVQYEERMKRLEDQIQETLRERDRIITSLESVESNSKEKSKQIKDEYEKRLNDMQWELKKLEDANRSQLKMLKEHSLIEKQCKAMQQQLLEMKKQKVQLMNKMKEDVQKNRQLELKRDKEINQLKKSQRLKDNQIKTMEAERRQKDIVLKRKQEEVESLRKRNRPVMSAKASGQMAKTEKEISGLESMRPKRPTKFPDKSSKSIWNEMEKTIASIVSKKKMLNGLEKDMERWIKQRNRLGQKLKALQQKQKEFRNDAELSNNIEAIMSNISYIHEHIAACQNNIVQLEEVKDDDPMKKLYGCSSSKLRYLLEYSINSIINKDLTLIEKEEKNLELSAKLHQQKMDSTYQGGMLTILIQDKENIEIDESLLHVRQDSDDEEDPDGDEEEHNNDHLLINHAMEPIVSSTPSRCPGDLPNCPPVEVSKTYEMHESPLFEYPLVGKKEKARRKTATPGELLFVGHGNPAFGTISEIADVEFTKEECPERAAVSQNSSDNRTGTSLLQKSSGNKLTDIISRFNENTNNSRQLNSRPPQANELSQHIPRKKPLSASSSLGSDSMSKAGSVASTNADVTPPASPGANKRAGGPNVFSRLTRQQHNSPYPPKGVIRSYSNKSNDNFPLVHCHSAHGHTKAVLSIFATDSHLFSGSKDRTAKMWDLESGEELLSFGNHLNNVVSVKYSESSGLVYTASTHLIKLWDPRKSGNCVKSLTSAGQAYDGTNEPVQRLHTCPQGETNIIDFCISTSGNNLFSAVGNFVKIWDMRAYKVVGKLTGGHQSAIMALAIDDTDTADGNTCIVTGSKDHYIKVYEVMEDVAGSVSPTYNLEPPHYDGIQSLCLKGDFLFSGSRDMCIKKWDLAGQQLVQSMNNAHKDWICGLTFLPSSNCLLSACRAGVMKVWGVDNCICVGEIQAHSSPINAITSNSQLIFSASNDTSIQVWKCKNNCGLFEAGNEF